MTGRQQERLDQAVAEIGPRSFGAQADAFSISEMDALLKDVKARHGRLDTVIANAVTDEHAPLGKITEEQFDKMVGINPRACFSRSSRRRRCCSATGRSSSSDRPHPSLRQRA